MSKQLDRVKACRKAHQRVVTKLVLQGEITGRVLTQLKTTGKQLTGKQLAEKTKTLKNYDEKVLPINTGDGDRKLCAGIRDCTQ